jgi:hypothetical protein
MEHRRHIPTILGRRRVAEDYVARLIAELQAAGQTSPRAIATALNERLIPTPSGQGLWRPHIVRRELVRLKV